MIRSSRESVSFSLDSQFQQEKRCSTPSGSRRTKLSEYGRGGDDVHLLSLRRYGTMWHPSLCRISPNPCLARRGPESAKTSIFAQGRRQQTTKIRREGKPHSSVRFPHPFRIVIPAIQLTPSRVRVNRVAATFFARPPQPRKPIKVIIISVTLSISRARFARHLRTEGLSASRKHDPII